MRYLFLVLLVLLVFPSIIFGETWIQFDRMKSPYTKRNGSVTTETKKTIYTKKVKNLTYGGDWIDPSLDSYKVIEKYARGDKLLVLFDVSDLQAAALTQATLPVFTNWTHSIGRNEKTILKSSKIFSFKDFNPVKLTNEQGIALKTLWGWRPVYIPPHEIESGTTK